MGSIGGLMIGHNAIIFTAENDKSALHTARPLLSGIRSNCNAILVNISRDLLEHSHVNLFTEPYLDRVDI